MRDRCVSLVLPVEAAGVAVDAYPCVDAYASIDVDAYACVDAYPYTCRPSEWTLSTASTHGKHTRR